MKKKQSFFQRLTGAINADDDYVEEEVTLTTNPSVTQTPWMEEAIQEAELAVDVMQTTDEIIVKTLVAGVSPEDLDVSISREMVTIKGSRQEHLDIQEQDYFHKELFWGSFARTILLPAEIEVEEAKAELKHGVLTIRMPKIDKQRKMKLDIRMV